MSDFVDTNTVTVNGFILAYKSFLLYYFSFKRIFAFSLHLKIKKFSTLVGSVVASALKIFA